MQQQQQLDKITKEISELLTKAVTELPGKGTYLKAIARCGDAVVGIDRPILTYIPTSGGIAKITHDGSHIGVLKVDTIHYHPCDISTNGGSFVCIDKGSRKPEVFVVIDQVTGRIRLPELVEGVHMMHHNTLIVRTCKDSSYSSYLIQLRVIEGNISVMVFNKMAFDSEIDHPCISYEHSRIVREMKDGVQIGTIDLEWKDGLTCKRNDTWGPVHPLAKPLCDTHIANENTIVCLGEHALEVLVLNDEATLVAEVRSVELGDQAKWDHVTSVPGYILVSGQSPRNGGSYIAVVKTDLI
jgi:hypothetical protein